MRHLIVAVLLCVSGTAAYGQACPVAPADPVPRDAARLEWPAVTKYTDGSDISATTRVTYLVYERVDGVDVRRCTTTATTAGQIGLSVGTHTWVVAAMSPDTDPAYIASGKSPAWSKTIVAAQAPPPAPTPIARRLSAPSALTGS